MGFVKQAAKGGLFGLAGLAASGAFKHKKNNEDKPQPSLITQPAPQPSLVNKSIY
jgi:hypothetical protein